MSTPLTQDRCLNQYKYKTKESRDDNRYRSIVIIYNNEIQGLFVYIDHNPLQFKAKMWAISSDTHQLHYIPKHHFII